MESEDKEERVNEKSVVDKLIYLAFHLQPCWVSCFCLVSSCFRHFFLLLVCLFTTLKVSTLLYLCKNRWLVHSAVHRAIPFTAEHAQRQTEVVKSFAFQMFHYTFQAVKMSPL